MHDTLRAALSASTESAVRLASLLNVLAVSFVLTGTTACDPPNELVSGLDEFEANEILVVLEAKGFDNASKVKLEGRLVSFAVVVPESSARDALRLLVANKLPRRRPIGMAEVYPAGSGGLIPTKSEEKAKFLMALQGDVERKLQRLPNIMSAHVTIVSPAKDVVRDLDTVPPAATASVALVFNPYDDRNTSLISEEEGTRLVAASVEDLKPQNVAVVMKKNEPAKLVDIFADGGSVGAPVTSMSVLGIKVADSAAASRVKILVAVFLFVGVLGLAVGAGGIVQSLRLKDQLNKANGELASFKKSRSATSTGMQPAA